MVPYLMLLIMAIQPVTSESNSQALNPGNRSQFISKEDLARFNTSEIRIIPEELRSSEVVDFSAGYYSYLFEKGYLKKEYEKGPDDDEVVDANAVAYNYSYKDEVNFELSQRQGNGPISNRNQKHFVDYEYSSGKLVSQKFGYKFTEADTTGIVYSSIRRFYYDAEGKLDYEVDFQLYENSASSDDESFFLDSVLSGANSGQTPNQTEAEEETFRRYYIYENNKIIGYYPARDYNQTELKASDDIYSSDKINELKKIGFDAFSKKYFTPEVLNKVVSDCYTPIAGKHIWLNNLPLQFFIKAQGLEMSDHIVLEVADNQFLFYNILPQ
jgi:hypothetical protein